MKKGIIFAVISAFLLLLTSVSQAESPANGIKLAIEKVRGICSTELGKTPDVQLDEKLRTIIYPLFDFEEMSKRSLGANWTKATPEEQKEFVSLFSDLLAKTYLKRIKRNAASSKIDQLTESIEGDKALVKSTVVVDDSEVAIDYRLFQKANDWKIYDVVIENVGLVSNYRSEFGATVRKDGMSGLIQQLKTKKSDQEKTK